MKIISDDRLGPFFDSLAQTWELRLPILLPDGSRVISSPG